VFFEVLAFFKDQNVVSLRIWIWFFFGLLDRWFSYGIGFGFSGFGLVSLTDFGS